MKQHNINFKRDYDKIVGRKDEIEELLRIYMRDEAQLVTVQGRRRVGKTFLVRETFKNRYAFYHTGLSPVELKGKNSGVFTKTIVLDDLFAR